MAMYRKIIYSPLASLAFLVLSNTFFMTFITVRLNMMDIPESTVGYIHSAFYGGMLTGALKSEDLINRVGHIRAFASFSCMLTVTIILQAYYQVPEIWILFRFFAGFSIAAAYVIIESWLLAQSTKRTKGKILALYMLCLYSSQAASQFILEIVDLKTIEPYLIAAVLASISVVPSSMTYMKAPEIELAPKVSIRKYFHTSPFGFIGCVVSGMMLGSIYSFLPQYAHDHDFSISTMVGVTISGGFFLQVPIGKLSDMLDRAKIMTSMSFGIVVCCSLLMFITSHPLVYIICFVLGGLCFTIYPVSIAQVCDHLDDSGNTINILGALLFAYGVGAVAGSPIVAILIELSSSDALFYFISLNSACLFMFGVYTIFRVESVEKKDQVEFVAVPRATPIANSLDPRSEE